MIELKQGTTLIEASAGTGKTYTLCRIALQLSLEKAIPLDRILCVTFTEAATEELAARIYELYLSSLHELEIGVYDEPLLKALAGRGKLDPEQAIQTLRYSLEVFDEAPISTIHSFCRRSLEQVALETQTPLDAELGPVETQLIERLESEYIREHILESSYALSLAWNWKKTEFRKQLKDLGHKTSSHPEAKVFPKPRPLRIDELERRVQEFPNAVADLLSKKERYLKHLHKARNVSKFLNGSKAGLVEMVERGKLLPGDFSLLEEFSTEKWTKAITKGGESLELPTLVTLCEVIKNGIEDSYLSLLLNYRRWIADQLTLAKQKANTISFNDLLHLLRRAITGENGGQLAVSLASQYDAALIDEFQDTDPTQLEIARTLFAGGEHYLFYIGDPKQAIYRFRGADIYAYFRATAGGAIDRIPLTKNFRSTPRLVEAVNHIFEYSKTGFGDERIKFTPVEPARDESDFPYSLESPVRISHYTLPDPSKAPGLQRYREFCAAQAANDLVKRLANDSRLEAKDVAFLVNTKREAKLLSDTLSRHGISCAIQAERSVFDTSEAEAIGQMLSSLCTPTRQNLKRGTFALLHGSICVDEMLSENFEEKFASFSEYISNWAREWFSSNFSVYFERLFDCIHEIAPIAGGFEAERRWANFSHLGELLSEAKDLENLSAQGLYNWLARKKQEDATQNEEWQTRIASDEPKPQILTIHKSKGLQFPVVFLPFMGLKRGFQNLQSCEYHDAEGNLVIDFQPDEESTQFVASQHEVLSEEIRLIYVALTRAERELHIYLSPEEISRYAKVDPFSRFAQFVLGDALEITSESLSHSLTTLAEKSGGKVAYTKCDYTDEDPDPRNYERKELPIETSARPRSLRNRERLPYAERVLSFSALNRALHVDDETSLLVVESNEPVGAVADEGEKQESDEEALSPTLPDEISIFTLPKGTEVGDLLHNVLENFDFSRPETIGQVTARAFEQEGFAQDEFRTIVEAQVLRISEVKLTAANDSFCLRDTNAADRVPELEFSYPTSGDVKSRIIEALRECDLGNIPSDWIKRLEHNEQPVFSAMLRGFIDLVLERNGRLYIFDWKSNFLGETIAAYNIEAIRESMAEHNYYLQYLLYCVALKRFVEWRFPDQHFREKFGGVFYIYARGISPDKDTGIYYDLPSEALLERLDMALGGEVRRG